MDEDELEVLVRMRLGGGDHSCGRREVRPRAARETTTLGVDPPERYELVRLAARLFAKLATRDLVGTLSIRDRAGREFTEESLDCWSILPDERDAPVLEHGDHRGPVVDLDRVEGLDRSLGRRANVFHGDAEPGARVLAADGADPGSFSAFLSRDPVSVEDPPSGGFVPLPGAPHRVQEGAGHGGRLLLARLRREGEGHDPLCDGVGPR